jgi:hypothetical protein
LAAFDHNSFLGLFDHYSFWWLFDHYSGVELRANSGQRRRLFGLYLPAADRPPLDRV